MPVQFKVVLHRGNPEEGIVLPGELSDRDWHQLVRFREEAAILQSCKWVQDGFPANFKLKGNIGSTLTVETPDRPEEIAVREFLLCIRPFVLQDEDTYFFKVVKVMSSGVRDKRFKAFLRPYKDRFTGNDRKKGYQIYSASVDISEMDNSVSVAEAFKGFEGRHLQLNTDEALNLWLYGYVYHRDEKKRREFVEKTGGEPGELALAIFRALLSGKVEAIMNFAHLLAAIEMGPSTRMT